MGSRTASSFACLQRHFEACFLITGSVNYVYIRVSLTRSSYKLPLEGPSTMKGGLCEGNKPWELPSTIAAARDVERGSNLNKKTPPYPGPNHEAQGLLKHL